MAYQRIAPKQAEALRERIRPIRRLFARCRQRLSDRHIDPESEIANAIVKAHDAVHSLSVTAHYDSIPRGVGRPPGENTGSGIRKPESASAAYLFLHAAPLRPEIHALGRQCRPSRKAIGARVLYGPGLQLIIIISHVQIL
jgi:hypothetical protein